MKKEYYNEQKANYIQEKLSLTSIDKVYHSLIIDIMLRRQFEYDLDDEILNRDVDTFIKNIKKIKVGTLSKKIKGEYSTTDKSIVLSEELFEGEYVDFEEIYLTLAHECTHAMNFEKVEKNLKDDRAFYSKDIDYNNEIMEIFTEYEADSLVYNKEYVNAENRIQLNQTKGYSNITPYIHLIAATFRSWNKTITR